MEKSGTLPSGFLSRYRHGGLVDLIEFVGRVDCAVDCAAEGVSSAVMVVLAVARCLLFTKVDFKSRA